MYVAVDTVYDMINHFGVRIDALENKVEQIMPTLT
jgi:hypothetical protein